MLGYLTRTARCYATTPNSQSLERVREQDLVPMPLWMNVRFYNLNDEIGLMDTVGNGQLDISDVEAFFPKSEYDPNDVANYLRTSRCTCSTSTGRSKRGSVRRPGRKQPLVGRAVRREWCRQPAPPRPAALPQGDASPHRQGDRSGVEVSFIGRRRASRRSAES